MIIQRKPVEARNILNFSQIKSSPLLQNEQFQPLLKDHDEAQIGQVLTKLNESRRNLDYRKSEKAGERNFQYAASLAGAAGGVWAALAGHPLVASAAAVVSLGMGTLGAFSHRSVKKYQAELEVAKGAYQATEKAGDELANSLVSDGPGPDQITDRRYYTSGIITGVATVHSRESGALLRTQVELGGNVPRKLEANIAKGTVSVRSPQGDETFPGKIELGSTDVAIASEASAGGGNLKQSISPDGTSTIYLTTSRNNYHYLGSEGAKGEKGFIASTYAWESGQAATVSGDNLIVANPIVPLQDLKPQSVRVLPDGVIGVKSHISGSYRADEVNLPGTQAIGTWASLTSPTHTIRMVEMTFGNDAFRVTSDLKSGTTRVTSADGSHVDSQATLVEINQTYRMQNQHVLGLMEQSLLPKEVLLTLQTGGRTLCVQHKSGQEPRAVEQEDKDFLEDVKSLPIELDAQGTYWVKDGGQRIEMKPMMPLSFLEKEAPAKSSN
ncbi:MAG: hypothetical protein U0931_41910 [Vulcanimicrobiota bacterium]